MELHQKGFGAEVKHTAVITQEEEDQLWDRGVLRVDSLLKLLCRVFFSVGKVFCIRGGKEQRNLKPSQFQWKHDPDRYVYIENGSKNNSGAELRVSNKVVPVYANPSIGERCVVYLLDLYLSKYPRMAFEKGIYYLRPKPVPVLKPDGP